MYCIYCNKLASNLISDNTTDLLNFEITVRRLLADLMTGKTRAANSIEFYSSSEIQIFSSSSLQH